MPRSIWNGTIAFGLISVPIKVHSATEDKTVHFHLVHAPDGARIKQKRICTEEDKEVPYKEVASGYQTGDGEYVLLSKQEIAAAAGDASHEIQIEEFVCAEEIDPVYLERTYYLGAGEKGRDAYRLLHDALRRSKRAGIGRWVFHNREYLAAVRPLDGVLALHTMRFEDEVVEADEFELAQPSRAPTRREIEMAERLVDELEEKFRPSAFKDTYRERVLELISRKAKGEEMELEAPEEAEPTSDLAAALEASLGSRRRSRSSRSGSRSSGRSKHQRRSGAGSSRRRSGTRS